MASMSSVTIPPEQWPKIIAGPMELPAWNVLTHHVGDEDRCKLFVEACSLDQSLRTHSGRLLPATRVRQVEHHLQSASPDGATARQVWERMHEHFIEEPDI